MSAISPPKKLDLLQRMTRLGVNEADLTEIFQKGSGPGGQKINKTSSLVILQHIPSGMVVRCQATRSQSQNRFLARRILVERLETQILQKKSAEAMRREKIRRQKRKRSRRAKEKMLEGKHQQSRKKRLRGSVRSDEF